MRRWQSDLRIGRPRRRDTVLPLRLPDGYFQSTPAPYADLGELAVGKKPGRQSDRERSMAINLGLAIEDMAVAVQIERAAQARGIGTRLPL